MGLIGGKAGHTAPWAVAGALALLIPVAASAQSVSDFRLPPAQPTDTRQQGPVDESVPIIVPVRPSPTPTQTASPPPSPQPAATPTAAPPPAGAQPGAARPAPRPAAQSAPGTPAPAVTTTAAAATPVPNAAGGTVPATTLPDSGAVPPGLAPAPAAPAEASALPAWWPFAAIGLAVLALAAGFLIGRRRGAAPTVVTFERPVVVTPPAAPQAAIPPAAAPDPAPASAAPAPAAPPAPDRPLTVTLEATRLSASLVAATLSYRLTVTNRSAAPLSTLAIEGDLIAAHGELPPERQLLQAGQRLELRHAVMALAPGESAELRGELRLPLTAINPIRAGGAALFIPLARFRVEAATEGSRALELAETFVVGELPEVAGAALRPFRLDLGPRTYSRIGQRAVA